MVRRDEVGGAGGAHGSIERGARRLLARGVALGEPYRLPVLGIAGPRPPPSEPPARV